MLMAFIGGAVGWKAGRLLDPWTGAVGAIVGTSLGFYYGRKIRKSVMP